MRVSRDPILAGVGLRLVAVLALGAVLWLGLLAVVL